MKKEGSKVPKQGEEITERRLTEICIKVKRRKELEEIVQAKKKTTDRNNVIKFEGLNMNLFEDFSEEIWARVEDEDLILRFYQIDKDCIETNNASYKVCDKFDWKEEEEIEAVPTEPRIIVDGKALEFIVKRKEGDFCLIYHQNYSLKAQVKEAIHLNIGLPGLTVTKVLDAYYNLDKTIEEPFNNAKFGSNEEQENELEVLLKEVATECNALVQKLAPIEKKPI
ncbi:hypothetical protein C2G38_2038717 [Gigaspora rosea]|uniref:Uncharacterized protein n=1 Tax=Gigaspora rosea TaxID=44941 RepID=A0A397V2Y0_9GLOM|nr:hypothetical protein C2G38_2038717 [Gigaspora rosea]